MKNLGPEVIARIRQIHAAGGVNLSMLAKRFGCSVSMIGKVIGRYPKAKSTKKALAVAFLLLAAMAHAQLTATPAITDFGSVPMGTPSVRIVTLTNTGNNMIAITDAHISNFAFSVLLQGYGPGLPIILLAPGEVACARVTFVPMLLGPDAGTLHIYQKTDTTMVDLADVSFKGTGIFSGAYSYAEPDSEPDAGPKLGNPHLDREHYPNRECVPDLSRRHARG
jgi:hypothetical protein